MTLETFFREVPRAAVAFSGGTDSAFLLWAAKKIRLPDTGLLYTYCLPAGV